MVRSDFATRLRQAQPALRGQLRRAEALRGLLRAVNQVPEPPKVADAILARFTEWIPASAHAVVVCSESRPTEVLASRCLPDGMTEVLERVAAWVMRHGEPFAAADLARDSRVPGPSASVIGIPLAGRRALGALVALDPHASASEPRLSPDVERAMRELLEPAAVTLENAIRLQHAEELSVTDDLTRLYNSRYLNQALRRESKRAARSGRPLSLLFIDLDGFKGINDSHGHLAGSRALRETAVLLRDSARETDIVARYGGDEFAVVLPDTNSQGAMMVACRVRERIAEHRFLADQGLEIGLTASVGIATMPDTASSAEELMLEADKAMYRVKARGKDGIEMAVSRR